MPDVGKRLVCPYCGGAVYMWWEEGYVECDDYTCGAEWAQDGAVLKLPRGSDD